MRNTIVTVSVCLALAATVAVATATTAADDVDGGGLMDRVLDRCRLGPGAVDCLRSNVLDYLEDGERTGRAADDTDLDVDERMVRAAGEYVQRRIVRDDGGSGQQQQQQQPQQQQQQQAATTTTTTARGLELFTFIGFLKVVQSLFKLGQSVAKLKQSQLNIAFLPFVADMEMGMMQDKMFMPMMMLMKMKMKMMMPIMMALVSMKATKALMLSKLAIVMVLGFMIKEFVKKSGLPALLPLHLPGLPGAPSEPPSTAGPPHMMYGPPQSSSGYEPSNSWEPTGYSSPSSSGGHHSSSYSSPSSSGYGSPSSDSSSHSLAYSSYLPSSSSSSGSSSSLTASKY